MGQKVSPIGLRMGINKTWESKWYADKKDFAKFLNNDVKIRRFLEKKLKDAAVASIIIERNDKVIKEIIERELEVELQPKFLLQEKFMLNKNQYKEEKLWNK